MWPYLVFGGLFAIGGTMGQARRPASILWGLLFIVTVLFVGLRHHVGMDWNNYLRMIASVDQARDLSDKLSMAEPLYALLLIFGNWSGAGIYLVNLISTTLAMAGIFAFARRTREPWMAMMAAMPFLIVVVGMSANRQALAVGLIMLVLANWYRLSVPLRVLAIIICAGFHASALLFLVFVVLGLRLPPVLKALGAAVFAAAAIYYLSGSDAAAYYSSAYMPGQQEALQSSGAIYHVAINAIPAAIYFALPRFRDQLLPNPLLRQMALAALLTLLVLPISSAAAGRISYYWFPVSMCFWAALPGILTPQMRRPVRLAICAAMVGLMTAWLLFANSSAAHIPYQNALLLEQYELEIGVVPA